VIVNGEYTKVRYVAADAINSRARQIHKARPDKAGVLYKIERTVRDGTFLAKGLQAPFSLEQMYMIGVY